MQKKIILTKEGLEKLKAELKKLKEETRLPLGLKRQRNLEIYPKIPNTRQPKINRHLRKAKLPNWNS